MTVGRDEAALLKGREVPDIVLNKPKLMMGLGLYLQAFYELDSERSHGMALTRIPWSRVVYYAEYHAYSEEQTDLLLHYISQMDAAHLKKLGEKNG